MRLVTSFRAMLGAAVCAALLSIATALLSIATPTPAAAAGAIPGFYQAPLPQVPSGAAMLSVADCRQSADLEKALRACKKIIKKSEIDGAALAAYLNRCAEIEVQLGKFDDAIANLERAMGKDPPNRKFEANLALVKGRAGR